MSKWRVETRATVVRVYMVDGTNEKDAEAATIGAMPYHEEDENEETMSCNAIIDPLDLFISQCLARVPNGRIESTELYRAYAAWAGTYGAEVLSHRRFVIGLKDRGYQLIKSARSVFLGIIFAPPKSDAEPKVDSDLAGADFIARRVERMQVGGHE